MISLLPEETTAVTVPLTTGVNFFNVCHRLDLLAGVVFVVDTNLTFLLIVVPTIGTSDVTTTRTNVMTFVTDNTITRTALTAAAFDTEDFRAGFTLMSCHFRPFRLKTSFELRTKRRRRG